MTDFRPIATPTGVRFSKRHLGPDTITNGEFSADTDWVKGVGWTIGSGVASSDGTQVGDSDLSQAATVVSGVRYRVQFTISNYVAGTLTPVLGAAGTARSADGAYTEMIIASATTTLLRANATFVGDVDNVSVRQLL